MRNPEDIAEDEFKTIFEENAMTEARKQNLSVLEGWDAFSGADGIRDRELSSRITYNSLHIGENKVSVRDAVVAATAYIMGYRDRAGAAFR